MRQSHGEDPYRAQQIRIVYAPPSCPANRPRVLAKPLPGLDGHKHSSYLSWAPTVKRPPVSRPISPQAESPLFRQLPPELRLTIWRELLSGKLLHVLRARNGVLAIECPYLCLRCDRVMQTIDRCPHEKPHPMLSKPWDHIRRKGTNISRSGESTADHFIYPGNRSALPVKLLGLLRTCRLVYSETVNVLYEGSVFAFNRLETVSQLPRVWPPQLFHAVREIHLAWTFKWRPVPGEAKTEEWAPQFEPAWHAAADILAAAQGLRTLLIRIDGWENSKLDALQSARLLQPLMKVQQAGRFEVCVPLGEGQLAELVKELGKRTCLPPFKLLEVVRHRRSH